MDEGVKKSLHYSLLDGIFASVMLGVGETFMAPYAIMMNAGAGLIGLLAALPNLAASLVQVKSATFAERLGSRRALVNTAVFIQALMWMPIIAIPYIFGRDQAVWLLAFYILFAATGAISFPPWFSMMGDYVPDTERGKVFGRRNRIFGLVNVSSMFLAGVILSFFGNARFLGFTIIFAIAFLARLVSWRFLTRMRELPLTVKEEDRFTILNFLRRMWRTNFGRFVIFVAAMNFATYLAAPFFAVYMLRDLGFSYLTYTVITMASTLTMFFMMRVWGAHADHVGNRRVLRLTSFFIPAIPILWLFSHNVIYLILVQIFAGIFWAGFNLSASNFIYDAVTPAKRTRCIAYFNVVNGLAISSGAIMGGCLFKALPNIFGYKILTLLLLSGVFRVAASALCYFVKEVRKVKDVTNIDLFYRLVGLKGGIQISGGGE